MNLNATTIAAALVAVLATPPTMPALSRLPDAEHDRLIALAGTWDVDMTFWFRPGGEGTPTKGTSTIRVILNGLFVEEKIEGMLNGKPFTTLGWTGYNRETKQYEATRIATTNSARISESGVWNAEAKQFELMATFPLAGETWTQRTVIQPISADAMTAASYMSFGKVPEWKGVEIKYTRKSK